jgi:hypothetical protein
MSTRPEELHPALTTAYNAGDLESMLALYDPKAVFVIKPRRRPLDASTPSGCPHC